MGHTRTFATPRRDDALVREGFLYCQSRVIRCPPPDRNYLEFAPKDIASTSSTTPTLSSPHAGFPLGAVGTASVFIVSVHSETSCVSYGHPWCNLNSNYVFSSSSFTQAITNLQQPPSHTRLYEAPGSSAAILQ